MGHGVFSGLAHFIKGGLFFWYGILTLGRWAGCFADIGWVRFFSRDAFINVADLPVGMECQTCRVNSAIGRVRGEFPDILLRFHQCFPRAPRRLGRFVERIRFRAHLYNGNVHWWRIGE